MTDPDLLDHGDRQVPPGAVDLAVNVLPGPPSWLRHRLAHVDLAGYPDPTRGVAAAAGRHGVPADRCLLTHGAAEAFWLLAQGLRPRLAACLHPSFTAPEAALRAAGVTVTRVHRRAEDDFALDPTAVPDAADLVVLGRPDNPTGRYDDVALVRRLTRPGRVVVVDEAFADFLVDPAEAAGLARLDLPGVVCVRSLTKLWGLAGLRVGYVLGPAAVLARLAVFRQPWPVSTPAVEAVVLASDAEQERQERAAQVADARERLLTDLAGLPVDVWESPANFLLLRGPDPELRDRLLGHGLALRRGETFPGLDPGFLRTAVSLDPLVRQTLVAALTEELTAPGAARVRVNRAPPPSRRTLVLGGARSGKSRHAEQLLTGHPEVLYVATGPVPDGSDHDWAARVDRHRRDRPAGWTTRETRDVAGALHEARVPVLVDCLATWLTAVMDRAGAWLAPPTPGWRSRVEAEVERLLAAWTSASVPVVAVSNEVGCGVVPATRSGGLFRDELGRLNQRVAAHSDDVRLMVAGRVHHLQEGSPR